MDIKELSKSLSSLTLHALLVATFGLILMLIAAVTEYAAGIFGPSGRAAVKVIKLALEIPFLLSILNLVVAESREPLKALAPTVMPMLILVRHLVPKKRNGRQPNQGRRPAAPRGRGRPARKAQEKQSRS